ncbi:hypothetical protein SS50377_24206 [Spironucleus salmonicida]|uniref:Uncharacterized protein n=1 Tax=Spironucleus salmonicida TaxID=348837 RepID=V6LVY7_9EUKA|nr:hypothetical protein SS50377_24206 [Spironucleus salmonicida]|eukprot:EST47871.1 Hypothetical protein SS50377_12063 [Spironucleus salmonicida]
MSTPPSASASLRQSSRFPDIDHNPKYQDLQPVDQKVFYQEQQQKRLLENRVKYLEMQLSKSKLNLVKSQKDSAENEVRMASTQMETELKTIHRLQAEKGLLERTKRTKQVYEENKKVYDSYDRSKRSKSQAADETRSVIRNELDRKKQHQQAEIDRKQRLHDATKVGNMNASQAVEQFKTDKASWARAKEAELWTQRSAQLSSDQSAIEQLKRKEEELLRKIQQGSQPNTPKSGSGASGTFSRSQLRD